jgi:methionyl-tRNA formyltransferase
VRTVFLGSPPFATPILDRLVRGPHRPVAVVTQPERPRGRGRQVEPSPVAEIARREGIELQMPAKATDPVFLDRLRALEPDVLFVVAYGKVLRADLLAIPRLASLNVHPSLLPRHRGATPIPAAILAGDARTGVTIQKVGLELDAGDVLCTAETAIEPEETAGELAARLAELSAELSERALELVASARADYAPQDDAAATYCAKLSKADGVIDWTRAADEIVRHVRAMTPWPGARATLPDGAELTVLRARATAGAGRLGEVLDAGRRLVVACGTGADEASGGAVELLEVKPAGKRAMSGTEVLRGARLDAGMVFGPGHAHGGGHEPAAPRTPPERGGPSADGGGRA